MIASSDENKIPRTPAPASPETDAPARGESASNRREDREPVEHGGPTGPEPTRYGDWERKGRCIDF